MNYILMHRSTEVAEIQIDDETTSIAGIGTLFAPEHIPIGITVKNNVPDRGDLNEWWRGRAIPASRQNLRMALNSLDVSSAEKLLTKCFGLSLSDHYWVNPIKRTLEWEKINFFDNLFSEDVGNIFFGSAVREQRLNLISPDNTSDGWLKKRWKVIDGKRCLIKGGSDPFQQQPLGEAMASIIMGRLGIPHVSYTVMWEDDLPFSVCQNFLCAETELVSAFNILNTKRIKNAHELFDHYLGCCLELGIPGAYASLDKMLVADYLIVNNDRHFGNFGAIRNARTLEWISPAPLYDNGSSFWFDQSAAKILKTDNMRSQPFLGTHEEQIELVSDFSWLDFSVLQGIDEVWGDLLRESPHIDETRRDALCVALRNRVDLLMEFAERRI